jgi:SHS2 domain-containing protein
MSIDLGVEKGSIKELKVDDKWSISYDTNNNDRPLRLFRYGENAHVDMHNEKNYVLAMFYRILELEEGNDKYETLKLYS